MSALSRQLWASLVSGALFGLGLVVSGMVQPTKVIGFLDFTGSWDPSLALVMGGAIAVHVIAYAIAGRRAAPWFAERFALPTRTDLDRKLLIGAALFGIGWGLGGLCPGPGLVASATLAADAAVFVIAMIVGMAVVARLESS